MEGGALKQSRQRTNNSARVLSAIVIALTLLGTGRGEDGAQAIVDFKRDVAPLLARHCHACHTEKSKGGLRLDRRADALRGGDSGKVIVPGKARESRLIRLDRGEDPEQVMPPKGSRLSAAEVAALEAWIDQGAAWPDDAAGEAPRHWAYVAPTRPEPPVTRNRTWARNPIDQFILARLEREGLEPSPEADRAVLLRRASLDLIGLPPALADVDAFLRESSARAYEDAVDRLLESPAYGERWARVWLDLARYADTQGYEKDNRRTIWRYRDWVIDAFNRNLPFDQFTIEQIAGDMLPDATLDQRIATAFHRNTMTNTEGGTDNEEFRTGAVVDRINTTFAVWLGTTFNCCQCHSHKYDPFTQKEYYQVFAFLNGTADADNDDESPYIEAPTAEEERKEARLHVEIAAAEQDLEKAAKENAPARAAWEAALAGAKTAWTVLEPASARSAKGAELKVLGDGSVLAGGSHPPQDTYTVDCTTRLDSVAVFRLEALTDSSLPKNGPGRADDGNFVLSRLAVSAAPAGGGGPSETKPVEIGSASADFSQEGFPVANAVAQKELAKSGWAVQPQAGKPHTAYFVPRAALASPGGSRITFTLEHGYERPGFSLGRFRFAVTSDPGAVQRSSTPPEILAIIDKPPPERSADETAKLTGHWKTVAPELAAQRDAIARLKAQVPKPATVPVMVELPKPRETHVHIRGNFLQKGEKVEPGVPAVLHPLPEGQPLNRLTFARWLVDPRSPLAARVIVNRIWEQYFGTGIVKTLEDFGTQGERPSHPELLDWLATELVRTGWDLKALHRTIVTSAAYRQSSRVTPELLEVDPENRLLARGPRVRLPAETLRDQALAASGLLSRKLHGPSVMPPQPEGLWQVVYSGDQWITSPGEDKYRRGLYTFWRRTMPHPAMVTFDAPSREYCAVKRPRTNTPLQALTGLNDPASFEAAQALARRILKETGPGATVEERAVHAFRLCLARRPNAAECARLVELFRSELEHYRAGGKAAEAIATKGLGPAPEGIDLSELAAWTMVSNVLLNLDELIMKG